jgi:Ca2+-binding RTX toxin-like protein
MGRTTLSNHHLPPNHGHVMNNTIKFLAVCVAAPLLALGVGAPAAWAGPNVSICHNGVTKFQKGSAIASCGAGSSAVATGAGSTAAAFGTGGGGRAVATGGSHATVGEIGGTDNTAIATHGSTAVAGVGSSNNTAIATNGSHATANDGTTAHAHNGQTVITH